MGLKMSENKIFVIDLLLLRLMHFTQDLNATCSIKSPVVRAHNSAFSELSAYSEKISKKTNQCSKLSYIFGSE